MILEQSMLAMRLRVMRRAHELGSVTAACREAGISRTLFYRWRGRFEQYGPDGLHPRALPRPARPAAADRPHVEWLVWGPALAWPMWVRPARQPPGAGDAVDTGPEQASAAGASGSRCSSITAPVPLRLADRADAAAPGPARHRGRHVHADRPGELVSLDTFYIGDLRGLGKVRQLTACDAASPTARPGSCRPSPPRPPRPSCARSWSRSIGGPAGRCSGC
jgi:hypothetical protein